MSSEQTGQVLTVAIAGALAAPLAAQAVDFSVSGHVARAIVITDQDSGSSTEVKDNASSGTRFRMTGSGELTTGSSAGINLEFGQSANLRKASVHFAGAGFGKLTLGLDSEAADSRAYSDKSGVLGIGHGHEKGAITATSGPYFDGLSGAGTMEGVHYVSPTFGPFSVEASVANGDRFSLSTVLSTETDTVAVRGEAGVLEHDNATVAGERTQTIGASLGIKLANGVTWSASWARGSNVGGADDEDLLHIVADPDTGAITAPATPRLPKHSYRDADGMWINPNTSKPSTDPSYFQTRVGYIFGSTHFGASFYRSEDFVTTGSTGTAFGVGALHNLPKAGVDIYASWQNYQVEDGMKDTSDDVIIVGTRVMF